MTILAAGTVDLIQSGGNPLFSFYADLADVCSRCSDVLQVIAFTLMFAGLLLQVYKGMIGGDLSGMFRHILVTGIIISIMPFYAEWMLAAQSALGSDLLTALEVDPLSVLINFGESFADSPFETSSAPEIIMGIFDPLAWLDWISQIIGMYFMVGISIIMYALFWCGFQIQVIAIYLGSAAAPIFLGMLVFEQTKDTAVKYHIGLLSICFWPLGWGLGMLFTEALMGQIGNAAVVCAFIFGPIMMEPITASVITTGGIIIMLLIIIVWLIVVLFAAPKVVSKAITTGANIGMGLISAAGSTAMGVGSAGVQAASGAAMMAGGAALTATGAGAAVGVGMMAGGAGTMGGAAGGLGKAVSSAGS
ncbi:MAG: type IV secretion system protein [Prosthecobacter sp.]|nr:type IV secretion system protein [Prosthecobacter sp.]